MLKATRPTASSIQFWEQTEHQKLVDQPVLQGSPQATIYGQQPVVNGYFARDHYACDFAASRASRRPRYRENRREREIPSEKAQRRPSGI
jgi:hypothetical protein